MSSSEQPSGDRDDGGHCEGFTIIPVDRTPEEKRAAYAVDWREPVTPQSWVDRLKTLL